MGVVPPPGAIEEGKAIEKLVFKREMAKYIEHICWATSPDANEVPEQPGQDDVVCTLFLGSIWNIRWDTCR
jgi:hypothetical protein